MVSCTLLNNYSATTTTKKVEICTLEEKTRIYIYCILYIVACKYIQQQRTDWNVSESKDFRKWQDTKESEKCVRKQKQEQEKK